MASKKALTDEELFAQFEDIPSETQAPPTRASRTPKPAAETATAKDKEDDDPLAELSALAAARPTSRPTTPRLSSSTTSGGTKPQHTPASSGPPSGRTSEDRLRTAPPSGGRKSTESTRSYHQSFTSGVDNDDGDAQSTPQQSQTESYQKPTRAPPTQSQEEKTSSGGGWWGSVFTAASAAVKQAEAAVKEIRGNEEAMRWAEQVKGNVETLKGFGILLPLLPRYSKVR